MEEKTLTLHLKSEWYDMIDAGIKKEEYREIKQYWTKRICKLEYTDKCMCNLCGEHHCCSFNKVKFIKGYTNETMTFRIQDIFVGMGNPEWGAPLNDDVFVIKLGERVTQ